MFKTTSWTIEVELPFDYVGYTKKTLITFKQLDKIVIEKTDSDITYNGNIVTCNLTPEETTLFRQNVQASVQVKMVLINNKTTATDIVYFMPENTLNEEVLI